MPQFVNWQSIFSLAHVLTNRHLLRPQLRVGELRAVPFRELQARGFVGVLFDKDNTLTLPYADELPPDAQVRWRARTPCVLRRAPVTAPVLRLAARHSTVSGAVWRAKRGDLLQRRRLERRREFRQGAALRASVWRRRRAAQHQSRLD